MNLALREKIGGINNNKRGLSLVRRSALFFIAGVVVFGLVEPGLYSALAVSNSAKSLAFSVC